MLKSESENLEGKRWNAKFRTWGQRRSKPFRIKWHLELRIRNMVEWHVQPGTWELGAELGICIRKWEEDRNNFMIYHKWDNSSINLYFLLSYLWYNLYSFIFYSKLEVWEFNVHVNMTMFSQWWTTCMKM